MSLERLLRDTPEGEDISREAFERAWSEQFRRLQAAQDELSEKFGPKAGALVDEALAKVTAIYFDICGTAYLEQTEVEEQ